MRARVVNAFRANSRDTIKHARVIGQCYGCLVKLLSEGYVCVCVVYKSDVLRKYTLRGGKKFVYSTTQSRG